MTYVQSLHPLWILAVMIGMFALGWIGGWCLRRDIDQQHARKEGCAEGYRAAVLDDTARRLRAACVVTSVQPMPFPQQEHLPERVPGGAGPSERLTFSTRPTGPK